MALASANSIFEGGGGGGRGGCLSGLVFNFFFAINLHMVQNISYKDH